MQLNFDFYDFQPIREKVNKSCDYFPLEIIRYICKIQFGYKPGSPIAQKYSVEIHYCDMAQFFV